MKKLPEKQPPDGWKVIRDIKTLADDGTAYASGPLRVVFGFRRYDGKSWAHLSVSCRDRLPTWDEMKRVKHDFLGPEIVALQVFAPESEWVNIHETCLHLWACMEDERPIPDFRVMGHI